MTKGKKHYIVQNNREVDKQTDRQTNIQTDSQKEKHILHEVKTHSVNSAIIIKTYTRSRVRRQIRLRD